MTPNHLAGVFPKSPELEGMTGEDIAKLLSLPVAADPLVASVAYVADKAPWPVLPCAALHGLAGDVVRTIGPHSEADPAAILIQTLAAVGNIIGPQPHCIPAGNGDGVRLGDRGKPDRSPHRKLC